MIMVDTLNTKPQSGQSNQIAQILGLVSNRDYHRTSRTMRRELQEPDLTYLHSYESKRWNRTMPTYKKNSTSTSNGRKLKKIIPGLAMLFVCLLLSLFPLQVTQSHCQYCFCIINIQQYYNVDFRYTYSCVLKSNPEYLELDQLLPHHQQTILASKSERSELG